VTISCRAATRGRGRFAEQRHDQPYAIAFGVSSADSLYGAVTVADLTLSNTDDGEPVAGGP
jgi:hypothetical protein